MTLSEEVTGLNKPVFILKAGEQQSSSKCRQTEVSKTSPPKVSNSPLQSLIEKPQLKIIKWERLKGGTFYWKPEEVYCTVHNKHTYTPASRLQPAQRNRGTKHPTPVFRHFLAFTSGSSSDEIKIDWDYFLTWLRIFSFDLHTTALIID